ncbi:hypothetical protein [uncultured Tenacibaculum sp.]|uniref:hypothetical protein n=1 Tax=uncultured Tenacibaculum sp. TaxID=174713 RepID=UPI00262730F5|nr:hypothetical protein [uncultured Tenacibaculum sp.]
MKKEAEKPIKSTNNFTSIGNYNSQVKEYLASHKLDIVTRQTVKLFQDNAKRNKLNDKQYNKAVESFNETHGLLLTKREIAHTQKKATPYQYINFPYLDKDGMKNAMDKYRQYVHNYNTKVAKANKEIVKYNKSVVSPQNISSNDLKRIEAIKSNSEGLLPFEYNKAVEQINTELKATILPKKRTQTIKYATEIVFNVLVGFYIAQLKERNTYLKAVNRSTSVYKNALPKLKIDNRKLATHTIAGIPRLSFCKKTAQNHIKRLREAGVLINYTYVNQNKPISVNFNPEIVQVLDGNPPKKQITQNELVNISSGKKLPHNNDTTRTFIKEKEIKDYENFIVENNSYSETDEIVCLADSYKNTTAINTFKQTGARENRETIRKLLPDFFKTTPKSQGINTTLTRNFLARLVDDRELAQDLSNGKYSSYTVLPYHYLRKVALYTNVSSEEFRAILIQDFIKSSAKIWKQHTDVHAGSWKNAINQLNEVLFSGITQKETLIEKLKEYRWKLEFARKWFKKHHHNALFPSLYFDVNRKTSNGVGFFGLHSVWLSHLKYQDKKAQRQRVNKRNENARKRKKSAKQKFVNALTAYKKKKYTAEQLYNYVKDNLPHEFLEQLIEIMNKEKN